MGLDTSLTEDGLCMASPQALVGYEDLDRLDVLQHLANIAEAQIRKSPGQWHQWFLYPEMISDGRETHVCQTA